MIQVMASASRAWYFAMPCLSFSNSPSSMERSMSISFSALCRNFSATCASGSGSRHEGLVFMASLSSCWKSLDHDCPSSSWLRYSRLRSRWARHTWRPPVSIVEYVEWRSETMIESLKCWGKCFSTAFMPRERSKKT